MGGTSQREFEEPMEDVVSMNGYNSRLTFGIGAKNAKKNNEDAYAFKIHKNITLFGVFDGHCGYEASKFCRDNLFTFLINKYEIDNDLFQSDQKLNEAYLEFDLQLEKYWVSKQPDVELHIREKSAQGVRVDPCCPGTTATDVIFLNLGDSCGSVSEMVYTNEFVGEEKKLQTGVLVTPLHHKAKNESEKRRVLKAGGFIKVHATVNYVTAKMKNKMVQMSRCFGNFELKTLEGLPRDQQVLLPFPFIIRKQFEYSTVRPDAEGYLEKNRKILIALYSDGASRITLPREEYGKTVFECFAETAIQNMVEKSGGEDKKMIEMTAEYFSELVKNYNGVDADLRDTVMRGMKEKICFPKNINVQGRRKAPLLSAICNEVISHSYSKKQTRIDYKDDSTIVLGLLDVMKK